MRASWTLSSTEKPQDVEAISEEPMILDERIATTTLGLVTLVSTEKIESGHRNLRIDGISSKGRPASFEIEVDLHKRATHVQSRSCRASSHD